MSRATALAVLATLLLAPACAGTDRPEGAVERWLRSLNQGEAGQPERYAPAALSHRILPPPREPNDLDVIEVGRGRVTGSAAVVPYRVEVLDGPKLDGTAELRRTSSGWRIASLGPPDPSLPVPSEGGRRIGEASAGLWLASLAAAAVLVLGTVLLMSLFAGEEAGPPRLEA